MRSNIARCHNDGSFLMSSPLWRRILSDVLRVAPARGRAETGEFSIEGLRLLERAVRAEVDLRRVVVADEFGVSPREASLLETLETAGVPVARAPRAEIDAVTDGRDLGGVLALAGIPRPMELRQLLARPGPVLVGCRTFDPGNVGALVRTAHALGAAGWCGVDACDPHHPRAVQTSRGSVFRLPLARADDLAAVKEAARSANRALVGAVTDGSPDLDAIPADAILVLGSEAHGLAAPERSLLDLEVSIATAPDVDSLSVNAAASIVLWAASRDRSRRPPPAPAR